MKSYVLQGSVFIGSIPLIYDCGNLVIGITAAECTYTYDFRAFGLDAGKLVAIGGQIWVLAGTDSTAGAGSRVASEGDN